MMTKGLFHCIRCNKSFETTEYSIRPLRQGYNGIMHGARCPRCNHACHNITINNKENNHDRN